MVLFGMQARPVSVIQGTPSWCESTGKEQVKDEALSVHNVIVGKLLMKFFDGMIVTIQDIRI